MLLLLAAKLFKGRNLTKIEMKNIYLNHEKEGNQKIDIVWFIIAGSVQGIFSFYHGPFCSWF